MAEEGSTDIYTHYRRDGEGNFWFHDGRSVRPDLPPGFYTIGQNPMTGELFLTPRDSLVDEIVPIPNPHAEESLRLAQQFIAGHFAQGLGEIGLINKLAMMLWGEPGTSKTVTIHQIMQFAISKNWVVLDGSSQLRHIAPAIRNIRQVEPGRGVVVIWEEFERLIDEGWETEILQLLDGADQLPNVLYILTTNYINRVPKRIFTRCRRIPFQVQFRYPGEEERRAFFTQKIPEKYRSRVNIEDWVAKTDGFSIDHCAQVLVGVFAFGYSVDDVIRDLKERMAIYGDGFKMQEDVKLEGMADAMEKTVSGYYDDEPMEGYAYASNAPKGRNMWHMAAEMKRIASDLKPKRTKKASRKMGCPLVVL